jgi:hypothetical protein
VGSNEEREKERKRKDRSEIEFRAEIIKPNFYCTEFQFNALIIIIIIIINVHFHKRHINCIQIFTMLNLWNITSKFALPCCHNSKCWLPNNNLHVTQQNLDGK